MLTLLIVEVLVRIFHLYTEDPPRFIDEFDVEKRVPGHSGYAVTGNRNQNFSKFNINKSGFNSYREFTPTKNKFEVAIIGDSFIEGFHQDYYDSTGKKIENILADNTEVYEYGYAGYDLANQLHLINAYKKDFDLIDEIIVYLNYESDLDREIYEPNHGRIRMLASTPFKIRDNIKILAYGSKIGILEPIKRLFSKNKEVESVDLDKPKEIKLSEKDQKIVDEERLKKFKSLIELYGFDKHKTSILYDSRKTSQLFIDYCNNNNITLIDFASSFKTSQKPTTLIYDWHWNNNGRNLIAKTIASFIKTKTNSIKTY